MNAEVRKHAAAERLAHTIHDCYHEMHATPFIEWTDLTPMARVIFMGLALEALNQAPEVLPADV